MLWKSKYTGINANNIHPCITGAGAHNIKYQKESLNKKQKKVKTKTKNLFAIPTPTFNLKGV